jgi:predicted RNase H-like HicB family nuclease
MPRYIALVDGEIGAYGVAFPDAPGCTAMGATLDEALRNAGEALAEWIADEIAAGREPAPPRSADEARRDPEVAQALAEGAMLTVVPLVMDYGRPTRINVSLDAGLLAAIDEAAAERKLTRSAFLSTAAREKITAGG